MIKKALLSAVVVSVLALSAQAAIFVRWEGPDGFYRSDDTTGLLAPVTGSQTAYAQLIYTPVNSYGTDMGELVGGGVVAGQQVLDTFIITDAGPNDYATFVDSFSTTFQAGFIFARVFDQGTGNPANIVAGTWYYNSPIIATVDNITANPTVFNIQGNNPSVINSGFGDTVFLQVVPEPSTLAFLGIGGLVLAIRRRKA